MTSDLKTKRQIMIELASKLLTIRQMRKYLDDQEAEVLEQAKILNDIDLD